MHERTPIRCGERCRVLVLGGWSPGPLDNLRADFCESCEFDAAPMHMPPCGALWLLTWEAALLFGGSYGGLRAYSAWSARYAAPSSPDYMDGIGRPLSRLGLLFALVALVGALGLLVVRGAVRRCVGTALAAIERQGTDVVVGFSWGGGIVCHLLADERSWRGPALVLAPTLSAMAAATLRPAPEPFFRVRPGGAVTIVHATHDPFCPPAQARALGSTGATMLLCNDSHDLCAAGSRAAIRQAFAGVLEQAAAAAAACDG